MNQFEMWACLLAMAMAAVNAVATAVTTNDSSRWPIHLGNTVGWTMLWAVLIVK